MEYTADMYVRKETGEIVNFNQMWEEMYYKAKELHVREEEYKEEHFERITLLEAVTRLKEQGVEVDLEQALKVVQDGYDEKTRLLRQEREERTRERYRSHDKRELKCRHDIIECMEKLMRNLNDEDLIEGWLMNGVPDGGDDTDVWDIAKDKDLYEGAVACFLRAMRYTSDPRSYFPYIVWSKEGRSSGVTDTTIWGFEKGRPRLEVNVDRYDKFDNLCESEMWYIDVDDVDKLVDALNSLKEVPKKVEKNKDNKEAE